MRNPSKHRYCSVCTASSSGEGICENMDLNHHPAFLYFHDVSLYTGHKSYGTVEVTVHCSKSVSRNFGGQRQRGPGGPQHPVDMGIHLNNG